MRSAEQSNSNHLGRPRHCDRR